MRVAINEGWIPSRLVKKGNGVFFELVRMPGRRPLRANLGLDLETCEQRTLIDADDLFARYRLRERSRTAGMIFHLSRCGSTLVSQMFQRVYECKVASEPAALGNVIQHYAGPKRDLAYLLRVVVDMLERALCEPEERLVIKWASWSAACMDLVHEAFPDTPKCFVHRDAVEVMVSLLDHPPGWAMVPGHGKPSDPTWRLVGDVDAGYVTEYVAMLRNAGYYDGAEQAECFARHLALLCRAVANAPAAVLPVDYAALPDAAIDEIAPLFNVQLSNGDRDRMRRAARVDTKSFDEARPFVPDSEEKQRRATAEIRELCARHVHPALEAVLARRQEARELMRAGTAADPASVQPRDATAPREGRRGPVVKWLD